MSALKELAYSAVDLLTLGNGINRHIGGESFRFPTRWSRYYEADYEPETFSFFRSHLKAGDTVLDIGAHIGIFAVLAARIVGEAGKVFAFEPTPFTREVLREVVALNAVDSIVKIRPEAVSLESGETVFFDTGDAISNANSLVRTERSQTEIPIKVTSVDEFSNENSLTINCLKIDVEGAELDLLRGAQKTFAEQRPVARLGLHPPFIAQNGQSLSEIYDTLREYRMRVLFEGEFLTEVDFCSHEQLFDVTLIPE